MKGCVCVCVCTRACMFKGAAWKGKQTWVKTNQKGCQILRAWIKSQWGGISSQGVEDQKGSSGEKGSASKHFQAQRSMTLTPSSPSLYADLYGNRRTWSQGWRKPELEGKERKQSQPLGFWAWLLASLSVADLNKESGISPNFTAVWSLVFQ